MSLRRSNSAGSYLAGQGVARARIATNGRGEYEPVASNDTEAGRQLNRRVEVAIYASDAYRAEVKKSLAGS